MLSLSNLWMFISVVVGVLTAGLCMVRVVMFLTAKSTIRSASDPRCRDRQLFLLATVYVVSITVSVAAFAAINPCCCWSVCRFLCYWCIGCCEPRAEQGY